MNLTKEIIYEISKTKFRQDAVDLIKNNIDNLLETTVSDAYRNDILIDSYLNLINFCLKKGFNFTEILDCLFIFYDLIQLLISDTTSLAQLVKHFTIKISQFESKFSNSRKINEFISYIGETLFDNYNLFSFVLTIERNDKTIYQTEQVIIPDNQNKDSPSLANAKTCAIWEYEQKIKILNEKEKEIINKYSIQRQQRLNQEDIERENLLNYIANDAFGNAQPLNNDQLIKDLIDKISMPLLNSTKNIIQNDIDELNHKIQLQIERKNIIVPPDDHQSMTTEVMKSCR
jgi:hypothetical protein